jgi:hypothetical protein
VYRLGNVIAMEKHQDENLKCERCATLNAASSRFCLACGAPLAAEWKALERIVEERLTERVRSVIKEDFVDQKALEIETSELIAERVAKWAKTFAYFVGIPVAFAALIITLGASVLGIIGLKTWSDIGAAQKELAVATTGLETAKSQLDAANSRARDALADADRFKQEIKDKRELLDSIPALQQRTKTLEELLKLDDFKRYLAAIGLSVPDKLPSVKVEKPEISVGYYDPSQELIVISPDATKDQSLVLRYYMHHVLYKQRGLDPTSDDRIEALQPFESFMAFYIPASFLNNPKIGNALSKGESQDYIYNLQGASDLREYDKLGPSETPYRGAEMLGRLFWDFRQAVGRDTADKFVVGAWQEFSSRSSAQSVKEFLRIFEKQFEQGAEARYRSEVKRAYQAHHVQL